MGALLGAINWKAALPLSEYILGCMALSLKDCMVTPILFIL